VFTRSGIQNKILEAWGAELPVLTTPQIMRAFEPFTGGMPCAVTARGAREFVEEAVGLLKDTTLSNIIVKNALRIVREQFDWRAIAQQLLDFVTTR
jgi:glycosyltransferase involved in cell wall biosynthesis